MAKNNRQSKNEEKENNTFLPLYPACTVPKNLQKSRQINTGLFYEKFCDQWIEMCDEEECEKSQNITTGFTLGENKQKWIIKFNNWVGNRQIIEHAVYRMRRLVRQRKGKVITMKTASRFIPGMGRPHPVENGINWHPTLGVPYLPGSSVKGMVRAWAESYNNVDEKTITRIFGPKKLEKSAGSVIFFDALPTQHVCLAMDIMTPHHSNYYQGKNKNPHEWEAPNPIPFLAVEEGQTFLFAIAPRRSQDQEDLDQVEHWLKEALETIGAGAKTAVGYGRFKMA
ncbi:MAG: type III-B CRISPR module RAMP protein Cmr6 [Thermoactinomyces sp.]